MMEPRFVACKYHTGVIVLTVSGGYQSHKMGVFFHLTQAPTDFGGERKRPAIGTMMREKDSSANTWLRPSGVPSLGTCQVFSTTDELFRGPGALASSPG